MIEVIATGPLATVQDLGRPGYAQLGVGRSGAADLASLIRANQIAGNPRSAAGLEITLGGFAARFTAPGTVALAGAPCPASLAGCPVSMNTPIPVAAGDVLRLRAPRDGLRTYLAVRGGINAPLVLGSRSTDVLAAITPLLVARGVTLPVGTATATGNAAVPAIGPAPDLSGEFVLRVLRGPRDDWFDPGALGLLCSAPYEVTRDSNRIGLRLAGPPLARAVAGELPPEGMVAGALQVPPDGQPVLFLADHPVTGGYPVIAVVASADLGLAAQTRPGRRLRFVR